jgi:hypothetical protein
MSYERRIGNHGRQSWFAERDGVPIGGKKEFLQYNYEELLIITQLDEKEKGGGVDG